jgi:hypothetical protein
MAFFQFRALIPAEGLPWSLCRGDIQANLRALKASPRPTHCDASAKAWDLMEVGWPLHSLQQMVQLMADAPFTTTVTEQLHASASVVARYHPEYQLDTLLARSMCLAVAKMLQKPPTVERAMAKAKAKLNRLNKAIPEKSSGRQVFFGDLCKVAGDKYHDVNELKKVRKTLMKKHSKAFDEKSNGFKRRYVQRARAEAAARRRQLLEQREAALQELRDARERAVQGARERGPLVLSNCLWGEKELELFQELENTEEFSRTNVFNLRDRACLGAPLFSQSLVDALHEQPTVEEETCAALPQWLRTVAAQRDFCEDVGFLCFVNGQEVAYKFVFAMQTPGVVFLCRMKPVDSWCDTTQGYQAPWPRRDFELEICLLTSAPVRCGSNSRLGLTRWGSWSTPRTWVQCNPACIPEVCGISTTSSSS